MKNYHITTFLDSLSPKTLTLEETMDLSRDRNELLLLLMKEDKGTKGFKNGRERERSEEEREGKGERNDDNMDKLKGRGTDTGEKR
jgi:hypothetical protein